VNVDLYVLNRCAKSWQLFGSLTVAARGVSDIYLHKKMFSLLRWCARKGHVFFPHLLWAYRIESGLDPAHRHLHFLLGGLPLTNTGLRFSIMRTWENLTGKGTARVREYDSSMSGESYLLKCLNFSETYGWQKTDQVRIAEAARELVKSTTLWQGRPSGVGVE